MVTNVQVQAQRGTLLEVKNLNVDYLASNGTVHAVTDVSFTLRRGEILGLAGESGSGKSTLAYAITRLLRPPAVITGGEILYYPQSAGSFASLRMTGARQAAHPGDDEAPLRTPPRITFTRLPTHGRRDERKNGKNEDAINRP